MPILSGEYNSIYVAGSNGMVGSALCKLLNEYGYTEQDKNLLTTSRKNLNLFMFQLTRYLVQLRKEILMRIQVTNLILHIQPQKHPATI